jgi:hypothetical protein
MGRAYTQYSFPDSGTENAYVLYSAFLNYRLPDGSLLHVQQKECWCATCNCFLMGEHVPDVWELEIEISHLLNPDRDTQVLIAVMGRPVEELLEEIRARIRWRKTREAPAKCLKCSSTEIIFVPDSNEFRHPKIGERVLVVGHGFASTTIWHAEFTTEGDMITSYEC